MSEDWWTGGPVVILGSSPSLDMSGDDYQSSTPNEEEYHIANTLPCGLFFDPIVPGTVLTPGLG